jgi:ATP-dependent DNA helicase PIF1
MKRINESIEDTKRIKIEDSLSIEQQKVFDEVIAKKNVFITGNAGTGKSFLLKKIIEQVKSEPGVVFTGSTGIAAWNIGGTTFHSFAGFGEATDSLTTMVEKMKLAKHKYIKRKWKKCNLLIIDEISMFSSTLFEKFEEFARIIRKNPKPFGGIQIVFCGDFLQLPPIDKKDRFCFESSKWKEVITNTFDLKMTFRQQDSKFAEILNQIRFGNVTDEIKEILKSRVGKELSQKPTLLFSHNSDVDTLNNRELNSIKEHPYEYIADDWFMFDALKNVFDKGCKALPKLTLKKGCLVMLIRNLDVKAGLVNGARGIVVDFDSKKNPIICFNGKNHCIERCDFTIESQGVTLAKRIQIPLVLAWATSIHKSQGMTIEFLKIDISKCFAPGQAYVALSRCKSIDGLSIMNLDFSKIQTSKKAIDYYKKLNQIQ